MKPHEAQTLRDLAAVVVDELELRRAARKVVTQEQALREQAQQLAATLRESVLPPRLPEIDGISLAAFYRPGDPSQVTGDFYDVFPQRPGRWLAAVGDVSGRGPAAAAATSLARYVLRAAAVDHDDPAQVLHAVNRVMLAGVDPLADVRHHYSALVATLDVSPERVRATVARAGHEPALVLRRDGRVETLGGRGSLLGWHPDVRFTTETAELVADDLLVLYTDGLTDARTEEGFLDRAGLAELLRANVSLPANQLARAVEDALTRFPAGIVDDAAALVLKVSSGGTAPHPARSSTCGMSFGPRPSLDIATRVADGRVIVVPRGELDATTAPDLAAALATAADRAAVLVLDLRELNFMDSSGLCVVLAAADGGNRGTSTAFFVVRGRRRVQRLFETTGMVDRIGWLAVPEAAPAGD